MRVQLAWTMAAELMVMVSGVLLLKLAANLLGPAGFGEYALSRRAIGLLYLPLVMGLGIAAPRYLAIARTGALRGHSERSFASAALIAGLIPPVIVAILLTLSPSSASALLFGSPMLEHLVQPVSLAIMGISLHSMVYAVFRGRLEMGFANTMQLASIGIVPLVAFAVADSEAAAVIQTTGIGWITVSSVALLALSFRLRREHTGEAGLGKHATLLLRFGLPRVPGEFALIGLFAIPALIAVRTEGLVAAGHFSAAMSLVTIISGAFTPIGLILLPRASAQAATGDLTAVRRMTAGILFAGTLVATVGVLAGELVIPPLIRWYFGPAFMPAVPVFRVCLLAAIPYVVYVLLRNILDALDVRALNSRNLMITLGVLLMLCFFRPTIMWMSWSLVASLSLLGVLTVRETYARLRAAPERPLAVTA